MYIVEPVTTYRVRNEKTYSVIVDGLTGETEANKIANGMNREYDKTNEIFRLKEETYLAKERNLNAKLAESTSVPA